MRKILTIFDCKDRGKLQNRLYSVWMLSCLDGNHPGDVVIQYYIPSANCSSDLKAVFTADDSVLLPLLDEADDFCKKNKIGISVSSYSEEAVSTYLLAETVVFRR